MADRLSAMDSLAKARLFGKSTMTAEERKKLAEQRMAAQAKRGSMTPTMARSARDSGPHASGKSGAQLFDRMRQEDKLADETGIKRRRQTKRDGY